MAQEYRGSGRRTCWPTDHRVVLFEAEGRLGGHARTVMAGRRGDQPVDTGFIVFNYVNYPHLVRLFEDLGVPVAESNMSFSASIGGGRLEYALNDLNAIFGQRKNILDPRYWMMLRDITRFNAQAVAAAKEPGLTIGGLIEKLRLGAWFRDYYLLPFSGAIWSTPKEGILDFPAHAMVRFFENHALLGYEGQHQWYTVQGGSIEYVRRLGEGLFRRGVDIRLGAPVDAVRRTPVGVEVKAKGAEWEAFDEVVFATHSDQTLAMLSDASGVERTALSAIRYQPNEAVLHADASHDAEAAALLGLVELCRGRRQGVREDRPDLLDELAPADPEGGSAVRDAEFHAADPGGADLRHRRRSIIRSTISPRLPRRRRCGRSTGRTPRGSAARG